MKASINLSFNGNCAEAIRLYEWSLPGKILFELTWGESPLAKDAPPACTAAGDLLGTALRQSCRSLRHRLGNQLRPPCDAELIPRIALGAINQRGLCRLTRG